MTGPLHGIRVFDMTRILAGPSCTQMLGDLGADVIKIERPGTGDDTRRFAPPFLPDADGNETGESAYFTCANRNKRSMTLDVNHPKGQELARRMIAKCDIFADNFKTGGLAKYGLDYDSLKGGNPGLIYCSITGFGQTGPYAKRPGYDVLIQGMGGFMSVTGDPDGEPQKAGIPVSDLIAGMYAGVAINAALRLHHQPHPLPSTVMGITSGLKQLRALDAESDKATAVIELFRGFTDMQVTEDFMRSGGTELAPMSTTTDLDVACGYALRKGKTNGALLMKIVTSNNLQRGADLTFVSMFPGESETLFPPLTFMQPTGKQQVVEVKQDNGDMFKLTIVEVTTTLP